MREGEGPHFARAIQRARTEGLPWKEAMRGLSLGRSASLGDLGERIVGQLNAMDATTAAALERHIFDTLDPQRVLVTADEPE